MNKKLVLTEFLELKHDDSLITEADKREEEEKGVMYLSGVLQRADAKNGNGRIYPYEVLKREVENYKKLVREGRASGELDHPDSSVIDLKNVSHMCTYIEMRGKDVYGKIKIFNNDIGKNAQELIKGGLKMGISSRGLGTVEERDGATYVNEDFQLLCFDLVSEPSTTGAFMLRESKEPNIFNRSDKINRIINEIIYKAENDSDR